MNPKNSFDMYHIWLAPRHILNLPTLVVTCTTVQQSQLHSGAKIQNGYKILSIDTYYKGKLAYPHFRY